MSSTQTYVTGTTATAIDPIGHKKHTISLFVNNKPGVLIRIALLFARRGYNIDSLVVSPSTDERFSIMTITASGDEKVLDQILKQLNKLVDVVHATDHTGEDLVQRELALIKVNCKPEERAELLQLAHALQCQTVDLSETSITLEITGKTEKLDNVERVLQRYGLIELIRTGRVIMVRGDRTTV